MHIKHRLPTCSIANQLRGSSGPAGCAGSGDSRNLDQTLAEMEPLAAGRSQSPTAETVVHFSGASQDYRGPDRMTPDLHRRGRYEKIVIILAKALTLKNNRLVGGNEERLIFCRGWRWRRGSNVCLGKYLAVLEMHRLVVPRR